MESNGTSKSSQLAYEDETFLASDDGRPVRILAEYLGPLHRFRRADVHDTIVFFGSARVTSDGPLGRYYLEARELARLLTHWSKNLPSHAHRYVVCTGGGGGIMEAANRGAADAERVRRDCREVSGLVGRLDPEGSKSRPVVDPS